MIAGNATDLRPLGAGELLDRAVTLYVRRFLAIVAVLAVVSIPVLLLSAWISADSTQTFSDVAKVLSTTGDRAASRAAGERLARESARNLGPQFLFLAVSFAVNLLQWTAVIAVVAAAYGGATISFGKAYSLAARLWARQFGVGLLYAGMMIAALIPLMIVYVVAILIAGALAALHQVAAAIVLGVVLLLAWFVLLLGGLGWIFIAYALSAVAVVVESANVFAAVGAGLRRTFSRGVRWRSVAAGLVTIAVETVGILVFAAVGMGLAVLLHAMPIYYAIAGAGNILITGLLAAFIVVYATDVRVRREGLDLASAVTVAPSQAPRSSLL